MAKNKGKTKAKVESRSRLGTMMEERKRKLEEIKKLGVDPYPAKYERTYSALQVTKLKDEVKVSVAGRIMGWREHGGATFADLKDESGQVQVYFQEDKLGKKDYEFLRLLDVGDFVGVKGEKFVTQKGEPTIRVSDYQLLTKALRPIPSTWHGLKDIEERYRKRYLDLIINPEVKKLLDTRWLIEREIREFLWSEGFTEVETSVLQSLYGGTNARPFTTHMNALDSDFYLRIAPELYLKRLVVGGYEKVFEIARNFRNEGIDATHQPEFTMIEWYEAYGDYNRIMDTAEKLTRHLVKKLTGGSKVVVNGEKIDVSGKWPRVPMTDLVGKYLRKDLDKVSDRELQQVMKKNSIELVGKFSRGKAIFTIFEHLITKTLRGPIWVVDYPLEVCPLQKKHREKEGYAERFEGYIGGVEYCDGWSEIIDPGEQRRRFEVEQEHMREGDEEAHPLDEDFIESLEYGMPPLGGIGIGIERLVMFLTDVWQIREVIAFPTLRPKNGKED